MAKFVNYKKRGIALPKGCKDLIDLLEPGKREKLKELVGPTPVMRETRNDSFTSNLSDIANPIRAVIESHACIAGLRLATMGVTAPDQNLALDIGRMPSETPTASLTFTESLASKKRMKEIFQNLGLRLPVASDPAAMFLKDQRIELIYEIQPLPGEARALSDLATEIFVGFCRLVPSSQLRGHFCEYTITP